MLQEMTDGHSDKHPNLFNKKFIMDFTKSNFKIDLRLTKYIKLLCLTQFCFDCWCFKRQFTRRQRLENKKLLRLYYMGQEKLESEMNVLGLIRQLRYMNIYLNSQITQDDTYFLLKHHRSNLIKIDSEADEYLEGDLDGPGVGVKSTKKGRFFRLLKEIYRQFCLFLILGAKQFLFSGLRCKFIILLIYQYKVNKNLDIFISIL